MEYKESFVTWTEQLLDQTNLSVDQIQSQTLPELKQITSLQVLNDAFLVILGYFFGQAVAKAATRKQD